MIYSKYKDKKYQAYFKFFSLRKSLINLCPIFIIKILFPITRHFKNIKGKDILDVGAGVGLMGYILEKKFQCKVTSIDLYLENIYSPRKNLKCDYLKFSSKKKFDLILMLDFIEHFEKNKIVEILKKTKKLIKNNGYILVKVPNLTNFAGQESAFGDYTHKTHFNSLSLSYLMSVSEFKVRYILGVAPNFNPIRLIYFMLSLPMIIFYYLYCKSLGMSSNILSPSIVVNISLTDTGDEKK